MFTDPLIFTLVALCVVVACILVGVLSEVWRDKELLNDIYCRINNLILKIKSKK